ncbi:MAG: YbhB/YbcL family Raf kinase inhibitor-like protein [Pseudomonadota bacterium]
MDIRSPAFAPQAQIPRRHTCEGDDIAPPLQWSGVPPRAASLVLIVDDPDAPDPAAPQRTWVHWVLYNLAPDTTGLPEGGRPLPAGTQQGQNDWHRSGYGGPCPPIGRHRYFFKLYALDKVLPTLATATEAAVEQAMQGHVIAQAQLIGTYEKQGR